MLIDIVKVILPSVTAFVLGVILTVPLTNFLYKHKMWKKRAGKVDMSGNNTPIFNELHKDREVNTPRMGGIVIWLSAALTMLGIWAVAYFFPTADTTKLDFLSRSQTWVPLATLLIGALFGLVDDILEIQGSKDNRAGGLSVTKRLILVGLIALLCASWFYFKLDVRTLGMPLGFLEIPIGIFFIPFFVLVTIALYSGGVIDGIDGLAGGIFAVMFLAYAGIAFYQQQIDLAAFCATIAGGILAFLWFNIPPARYYMSETGTMGLTITLAVVAFMTDALGDGYGVLVLPMIALPLVITIGSNIIQVLSKKYRGKKVFLVAPVHHHFEAIGWPPYKVTMRYWIFGVVCALLGIILAIIG